KLLFLCPGGIGDDLVSSVDKLSALNYFDPGHGRVFIERNTVNQPGAGSSILYRDCILCDRYRLKDTVNLFQIARQGNRQTQSFGTAQANSSRRAYHDLGPDVRFTLRTIT